MKPHEIKQGTIITCAKTGKPLFRYLRTVPCRHKLKAEDLEKLADKTIPKKKKLQRDHLIYRGVAFAVLGENGYVTQIHTETGWVGGAPPAPKKSKSLKAKG